MVEAHGVETFTHPADLIEPQNRDALIDEFRELLTPLFLYLARGRSQRNVALRTWVLLYLVRRDLINGETIDQRANAAGVNVATIKVLIREFRTNFPSFRRRGKVYPATRHRESPPPGGA